jgi:hypothetical protein
MPMSELSPGAKQLQESMQRLFIAARNGDLTPNEYRKEQQRLLSSAHPSIAQELIEYNTVLNTDLLNETQFYREPTLPVDEAAYDAVTYMGRVPFGSEDSKYLYRKGSGGVRGVNVEPTEYGKSVGGIEHILIAGRNLYDENTPVIEHEGLHAVGQPQGVDDEVATRALDYFRYQRLGDEEGMRRVAKGLRENGFSAFDPENPESMKFLRLYAAKKAMSMDPEYLDLMDKEELSAAYDSRIEEPGIFDALGELVGGEPAEPEFEPFLMGPRHMRDFSDEEFQTFLDEAPAFQYEPMETQPRTSTVTPRMVPDGDSMVRGYQNGGGIGYFERPEGEYGVEPSQFEQDVTQQPGRVYDTIFTPMSRAESVQHPLYGASEEPYEFDPAGGIMGMAGRALSTFDRKLSGLPVSDEQLAGAAMDIVPTSAGIASTAFGPAMLPGMLGAFSMKHGSGRLFNFFARNPKSTSDYTLLRERTAGPGTYLGDEEVAVGYARRFAERDFAGEEDVAYDVAFPFGVDIEDMRANPKKYDPDVIDDPKLREDTDRALSDVLEDANRRAESKVVDMDNGKIMYFFEDGSTLVRNLNPTQDGRPVIEPLGKGAGFVYDVMVNAEKEHFLDFSKPLFKQPDFVASKIQDLRRLVELDDKATGSQFYGKLKQKLGGEEEATKALIDLGIIGNRFEQRGKEMMVVFDPDNLSIEKTTPYERFADGGVVSLKDKAVNMTRGPRSNGIMQYVPYMTGATNGY